MDVSNLDVSSYKKLAMSEYRMTEEIPETTGMLEKTVSGQCEQAGNQSSDRPDCVADTDQQSIQDAEEQLEAWNNPKRNILRLGASYFCFIIMGMNDSSLGVLVPHLEPFYNVNYMIVSLAFLLPFVGYLCAAFLGEYVHRTVGRWGAMIAATSFQLLAYIIAITAPKFYGYLIGLAIGGFGGGLMEASLNSWIGSMRHANQLMGLLHGFYGVGGIICPTIFTAMLGKGIRWNICYAVLIAFASTGVALSFSAFYGDGPKKYRKSVGKEENDKISLSGTMKSPVVWVVSFVLFFYVGGEITFGGWLPTFMIDVRHGDPNTMGYVSTGYWCGLTLGRILLGFVNGKLKKDEIVNSMYMASAIVLMLLMWLIPNLYCSAVMAAFFGMAIGPIFPTVVVVAVRKLPKEMHVSGVGFAAAFGGIGAALFPFVNGILTNEHGPNSLAPLIVALFGVMLILWVLLWKSDSWFRSRSPAKADL